MIRLPKNKKARLEFLIQWSSMSLSNATPPQERRAQFMKIRRSRKLNRAKCWACDREAALVRHHIIQIQNGGTNDGQNLVAICEWCHAEVHSWMDAPEDHPVALAIKEMDGGSK